MELLLKKQGGVLRAADLLNAQHLEEISEGEYLLVQTKKERNGKFHAKFFSLLKFAYDNQDKYDNFTSFRHEVQMRAGWYDMHVTLKGKTLYFPKSISFSQMDDVEFAQLFDKCIDVILKHFMRGATESQILQVIGYD